MNQNNGDVPQNTWLANEFGILKSGISNHTKRLKEEGYLRSDITKKYIPTEKGISFIRNSSIVPTQIPLVGSVTGGPSDFDDVIVDIHSTDLHNFQFSSDEFGTITIPASVEGKTTFALTVFGESMVSEGIQNGDYVIVEVFDNAESPRHGELIVTEYLKMDEVNIEELETLSSIPNDYRGGPTVKYYFEDSKSKQIVLGLRKSLKENESKKTIITKVINPIGRVIGVYRDIT